MASETPEDVDSTAMAHQQLIEIEALLERQSPYHASTTYAPSPTATLRRFPPTPESEKEERSFYDVKTPPFHQYSQSIPARPDIPSNDSTVKPMSRTAYLDGLRGFAALLVYVLHNQVWARVGLVEEQTLENAFGWQGRYHFATLPGVRIFFSGGHAAVPIFFIISGYVLVSKPLSLVHKNDMAALAENLCSGLFRRWLRLFIPVVTTTLLWAASWHLFGIQSSLPGSRRPEKNIWDELWMWYCDFKNFSFVFNDNFKNAYNDNMWTIPVEFRGSVLVWTSVLAFARASPMKRIIGEAGLVVYFLLVTDGWYLSLFMAGVLFCDIDLLTLHGRLPASLARFSKPQMQWVYWILLAIGIYLAGVPSVALEVERLREQPGWYYLSFLKPQAVWDVRHFFRAVAAMIIMTCIPRLPPLKRFFETDFCQYLGKISFSLYLVHGPVLWSIGDRIYAAVGRVQPHQIGLVPGWINAFQFPKFGPFGLEMNTLAAQLVLLPLTLGLAELVTTLIDTPSVRWTSKLFKWTTEELRSEKQDILIKHKPSHSY